MSDTITQLEDTLIDLTKTRLGEIAKNIHVESLAGEFTTETLKRLVRKTPGVFWSFLGGKPRKDYFDELVVDGSWALYVVTDHASGEKPRRRGDKRQLGVYQLISHLAPYFHGIKIDGVGTMSANRIQNLFSGVYEKQGIALYGCSFNLPMALELGADDSLDDFLTFHADVDIEPHEDSAEHDKWLEEPPDHSTSTPDASDTVTLEQGP